jgi:hypothetical protein
LTRQDEAHAPAYGHRRRRTASGLSPARSRDSERASRRLLLG